MIVRTVFIDLDDTLWATTRNNQAALREVYEARGWSRVIPTFETLRDVYQPINDHLWHLYRMGEITKPELSVRRFREPLEHFMGPLSDEMIEEINTQFLSLTASKKEIIPGAVELLQALRERYRIVILSNGFTEVQRRKMTSAGLLPYVDHVVLSEMAGVNKPSKAIFDYALSYSRSRRSETVMIGDDWESDITGASNAGIPAIWFNPRGLATPDERLRVPLYQVRTLAEIPALLRSLTTLTRV